ncbi:hypothetical protein GCM10027413_23310 [Conyzicola nivalis]|uniref:Uncharacterized protein n=1 Tax=Conyzicola nivalis TaxID=1477021 RepID=A0A916SBB3_9MICO|nr:hypothetical protein [Conyzicola nivalis]GGA91966.1 hypothetical protein GCM10010979_03310 [Conyzicola nivalis]
MDYPRVGDRPSASTVRTLVARDGWISLFIAVAVAGGTAILPVLCIAILPAWLLVSRGPEMIVHEKSHEGETQ